MKQSIQQFLQENWARNTHLDPSILNDVRAYNTWRYDFDCKCIQNSVALKYYGAWNYIYDVVWWTLTSYDNLCSGQNQVLATGERNSWAFFPSKCSVYDENFMVPCLLVSKTRLCEDVEVLGLKYMIAALFYLLKFKETFDCVFVENALQLSVC